MRVLMIDNYDSFTWNLVQALRGLGAEVDVYRNDAIDVPTALASGASHFLVSPGPGHPVEAGVSVALIQAAIAGRRPLLGVCLGHQALALALGGVVRRAQRLAHGEASEIEHDGTGVFIGLQPRFLAGRYHSLAVDAATLPATLRVTARTDDGEVMGLAHRDAPVEGVQFHPESVLTPLGGQLLANFLRRADA